MLISMYCGSNLDGLAQGAGGLVGLVDVVADIGAVVEFFSAMYPGYRLWSTTGMKPPEAPVATGLVSALL